MEELQERVRLTPPRTDAPSQCPGAYRKATAKPRGWSINLQAAFEWSPLTPQELSAVSEFRNQPVIVFRVDLLRVNVSVLLPDLFDYAVHVELSGRFTQRVSHGIPHLSHRERHIAFFRWRN